MSLGTRAIARIAKGGDGFAQAKKIAELFVATNTGDNGDVLDPAVYQRAMDILAPFAGTLDGQNTIADYNNKMKALSTKKNEVETNLSSLQQKEYSAWYVDEDGEDNTSFRNPEWVAQMTSESLDMIVAETVGKISELEAAGKSTGEVETYLRGLVTRADRMRSVAQSFQDGTEANLDGYGYFVDSDPNTGEIRGASFMPTDESFKYLSDGKKRTDSMVTVGNKKVPVYLPVVKMADGTEIAKFGGTNYESDGDVLSSGVESISLSDRNAFKGISSKFQLGQLYQAFSGKTNIDGSYKKDYVYIGNDNKVYKFNDDEPTGKAFLDSLKQTGVVGDKIPSLNPADVATFATEPLPGDTAELSYDAGRTMKIRRYQEEGAVMQAESDALNNRNVISETIDGATDIVSSGFEKVKGFFSGVRPQGGFKNRQNKPNEVSTSVNGASSAPDVVDSGKGFFRNKVT